MKTLLTAAIAAVLLVGTVSAQLPKFGAGAFGGVSIPVVQDDQTNGTVFGARGRVGLLPILQIEPYFASTQWGAPDPVDGVNLGIDGSTVTAFGLDATIGFPPAKLGLKPFLTGGIGSFKVKNDDTGYDESKLGFNAGLGLGIGVSPFLDIDVRGVAMIAPQESGSKKAINLMAGVTYNFGIK
ncbi:MAG TPA: outer membrane beta-barrel protein [candidate division Zixibacteria bacterium]|nr:outer membrane beta-barrel protein [candidate division Zixibacteria bacterium]